MGNDRDVAVCVIVFNRPEITQKLFNILKENSPKNLHIICDGPRNELEKINVDRVKDIFENIDWPCHVTKDYANQNMGCRERIVSGLDNLFKLYGAAIILEDDCHPVDPIFFEYCYNMLERYWEDDSIMHISGFQPMTDVLHDNSSYLATFPFVWGWATWADSWKKNISNTSVLRKVHQKKIADFNIDKRILMSIDNVFKDIEQGSLKTWDYTWWASILANDGYCITPMFSMIKNMGFGEDSTHTRNIPSFLARKQSDIPKTYSTKTIGYRKDLDEKFIKRLFYRRSFWIKTIRSLVKKLVKADVDSIDWLNGRR